MRMRKGLLYLFPDCLNSARSDKEEMHEDKDNYKKTTAGPEGPARYIALTS